jgi:plasmid stabilization system protein ParE
MKVIWSPLAIQHLEALCDYVTLDNPEAATDMAARILQAVDALALHPGMGRPGRKIGTRELVVNGTPCVIPYRVRKDYLELIAIFHGRQNWQSLM